MKILALMLAMTGTAALVISCQKETSSGKSKTGIIADKSNVAAGEHVNLTLENKPRGSVARWTVSPSDGVSVDSVYSRDQNTLSFSEPGTYEVSAELRIVNADCLPSPGWDTCYLSSAAGERVSAKISVGN